MFASIRQLIISPYSFLQERSEQPPMGLPFWLFYLSSFLVVFNIIYPVKLGLTSMDFLPPEIIGAIMYLQQANILEISGVAAILALVLLLLWVVAGLILHFSLKIIGGSGDRKFSVALAVIGYSALAMLFQGIANFIYLKVFDQSFVYSSDMIGKITHTMDGFLLWQIILFIIGLRAFYPDLPKWKWAIISLVWVAIIIGISFVRMGVQL